MTQPRTPGRFKALQHLESGEVENPPVRYLISCAVALGLDDWHLLLEDKWREPLPGSRRVSGPRTAGRAPGWETDAGVPDWSHEEFLTVAEVAELLRLNQQTIRNG